MPARDDGGLGAQLVGDRIAVNHRTVQVTKLLGEGGFSYVYLVKEISSSSPNNPDAGGSGNVSPASPNASGTDSSNARSSNNSSSNSTSKNMVLKITSIHSRQQRSIAEKEAKLLSRLSHPSIIKMYDSASRTVDAISGSLLFGGSKKDPTTLTAKERSQHLILMEYCEGGHALDVCTRLKESKQQFDLSSLIIAFGQICNAVSYLHAQRPPIVHRDLKPVNFLVKNGAYKLCDFGSAVFGHVELKTQQQRVEAEEVIEKTTTQMFRAPEMVDLHMAKKLTQSTDVWALGCCLYSLAFLQNCFEEGSNLAILSRNFKIPDDNPYGPSLVDLIDRMLTVDPKARADMTEVILCLSAIYSGKPLPKRKVPKTKRSSSLEAIETAPEVDKSERVGTYRTDGQGIRKSKQVDVKKPVEAKKLNPNSAAARRRRAAQSGEGTPQNTRGSFPESSLKKAQFKGSFGDNFDTKPAAAAAAASPNPSATADDDDDLAFSPRAGNPFPDLKDESNANDAILGSFQQNDRAGSEFLSFDSESWDEQQLLPTFSPDEDSAIMALNGSREDLERLNISGDVDPRSKEQRRRRAKAK